MPFYFIHSNQKQLNIWDLFAAAVCLTGVTVAYFADTQIYNFMNRKAEGKEAAAAVAVLEEGLWRFSRHPNYFGEQLWWLGVAVFGRNVEYGGWFVGPAANAVCLGIVTVLVEERMLKEEWRAESYKKYQKTTSVWVPWFRTSMAGKEKKT